MNHFYTSPEELKKETTEITGRDYAHLKKSLRIRPGEEIELLDGENHRALGKVEAVTDEAIKITLSEYGPSKRENENARVTLYQGVPKGSKLKQIVEKSTELGVAEIVPVYTRRSISRPSKSDSKKYVQLNETAHQASKQCGRGVLPFVQEFISFEDALESLDRFDLILLAYEEEEMRTLKDVLEGIDSPVKIALFIGPEGGFDADEVEAIKKHGGVVVSLGPRILRTETAGSAALAQINYALE